MVNRYKCQCRQYPLVGKTKVCCHCRESKDLSLFGVVSNNTDGHSGVCRNCNAIARSKGVRVLDQERDGVFYRVCRRCKREQPLNEFPDHPECLNGKQRVCKDCKRINAKNNGYYSKDRRHAKESRSPQSKMTRILRTRIACALIKYKNSRVTKAAKTLEIIGCDINHLIRHLESLWQPGMSWANHGSYLTGDMMTWHVDHIKPCDAFDLTDPEQQRACFHYTNLQPLWATDNLQKGHTLCHENT